MGCGETAAMQRPARETILANPSLACFCLCGGRALPSELVTGSLVFGLPLLFPRRYTLSLLRVVSSSVTKIRPCHRRRHVNVPEARQSSLHRLIDGARSTTRPR